MHYRYHQFDMPHPFPADLLLCHFNTTAVANDTLITDTLILSAGALIILYRSEYPFTEKAIPFRFIRTVVDGFRFQYFSVAPFQDTVG